MHIAQGEHVALVGPSGAGKTTLLNLLLCFWELQEGQIILGGKEIQHLRQAELLRLFGVISQHTHLFHGSIQDNLRLAKPDATDAQLSQAVHDAGLDMD